MIYQPSEEEEICSEIDFGGVTIRKPENVDNHQIFANTNAEKWQLVGVYRKKVWEDRTPTEYGFAANNGVVNNNDGYPTDGKITAGEFVRAGKNAQIKAMRCYLKYNGEGVLAESKSAVVLPERIILVFPDETATVVDPDIDPTTSPDITTPTSELAPASGNAKVWSFAHTIYIDAAPGTAYRIIDASGRTLKNGITATDRDKISLGNHGGIAIVIIGGRAYKLQY